MADALSNNIREIRKHRGWSQEQLAAEISEDVTVATISRLESGRMALTQAWMQRIAAALGVSIHEIIADAGGQIKMVPVIGQISAGTWQEAVGEPDGWVPVPPRAGGPKAFALKPLGDSMSEIVDEDGYAIVDPDQRELVSGKVYALMNEHGETTFKRYAESPPRLVPCSMNPEHQTVLLGSEPLIVIGRVTWATRPVD